MPINFWLLPLAYVRNFQMEWLASLPSKQDKNNSVKCVEGTLSYATSPVNYASLFPCMQP